MGDILNAIITFFTGGESNQSSPEPKGGAKGEDKHEKRDGSPEPDTGGIPASRKERNKESQSRNPTEDGSPPPPGDGSPHPHGDGSPHPHHDASPHPHHDGSPHPVEKFMLPPMRVSKFKYSSMRSAYSIHQ
jgi:hypothetical protein